MLLQTLVLCFVIYRLYCFFLGPLRRLPGPKGLPIFGQFFQLDPKLTYVQLSKWSNKYGSVYKFSVFDRMTVVVTGSEALQEVMVKRGTDFAGRISDFRMRFSTDDNKDLIFSTYDSKVKWMRKFCHKSLHAYGSGWQRLEDISLEEISDFIEEVECLNGDAVNPIPIIQLATLAIMYIIMFGEKADKSGSTFKAIQKVDQLSSEALAPGGKGSELDVFPWMRFFGNSTFTKLKELKSVYSQVYETWHTKYEQDRDSVGGMLAELFECKAERDRIGISDTHVQNLIWDIVGAGSMTTTSALSSFCNIMVHYPDVQKRLQQEVDQVVGSDRVKLSYIKDMPYTRATIFELLRFVTPAPLAVPHCTTRTTILQGQQIPKGTDVLLNLWGQHHDEKIWHEPFIFDPTRFLDQDGCLVAADHPSRQQFVAFSAGPRGCLGEALGHNRLYLFVATLLQRFSLKPGSTIDKQVSCHPTNMVSGAIIIPKPYEVKFITRATSN